MYDVTAQNKSRKWFTVSGRSKQASKQAYIHMHGCNEVTLVWGSLRLAPIIMPKNYAGIICQGLTYMSGPA